MSTYSEDRDGLLKNFAAPYTTVFPGEHCFAKRQFLFDKNGIAMLGFCEIGNFMTLYVAYIWTDSIF